MSYEATILGILTGNAAVTAIVPAARIYFGTAAQGVGEPFIACFRITTEPANTFEQGRSAQKPTRLDNVRLQVTCYARGYAQANALARAVRNALEAQTHPRCLTVDQRGDYDDMPDLHGQILTFSTWYRSNVVDES